MRIVKVAAVLGSIVAMASLINFSIGKESRVNGAELLEYLSKEKTNTSEKLAMVERNVWSQFAEIDDTKLVMDISFSKNLYYGSNIVVEVKICNTGNRPAFIYMPGLSLRRKQQYAEHLDESLIRDALGYNGRYARCRSDSIKDDYLLLTPGDNYGRSFNVLVPCLDGCKIGFDVTYECSVKLTAEQWIGNVNFTTAFLPVTKSTGKTVP